MDHSYPKIEGIYYAVKFYHRMLGFLDPTDSTVVQSMLEAAKRMLCHKINKKKPITVAHLHQLYRLLILDSNTLSDQRTMVVCLLGFCGFMRYSEICNLQRSDIYFESTYVKLFIEKSKTDIYREGNWIYLSKSGSVLCPVENLTAYLRLAKVHQRSDEYVFRAITVFKKLQVEELRHTNRPLSYSRMRDILLDSLAKIGLDPKLFGLHSLRSGGATSAANAGVPDRLFKRHGRWRSDRAKDGYVEDCLTSLLSVSQSLGI